MEENTVVPETIEDTDFTVLSSVLTEGSYLSGKTLRETDMRKSGCMILSVLKDGKLITNPGADFRFSPSDTIWIAGEQKSCEWFI